MADVCRTESNAIEATYRAFDERMKGKKRKKALPVAPAPLKPATFTLPVAPTVHDELDEYLEPILEADPPASPVCTKPEPTSLYSLREQTSNVFSVLNFDSEDETPTSQLKPATFVFPKSQ